MFALKVFLYFAAAGFSTAFVPVALIPDARRLHRFTATAGRSTGHFVLSEPQSETSINDNPVVSSTKADSDLTTTSFDKTSESSDINGSFEYVAEVTTGKLVVSFEPDDPMPTPPPPPPPPIPEVFPGMKLPPNEIPPSLPNADVFTTIQMFLGNMVPAAFPLNGKPKSDGLGPVQEAFIRTTLQGTVPNDPDYKFFGNSDNSKILTHLLKTDPFFASALTKTRHGFELKAFDRKDPDCKNSPSLFRKVACTLTGAGHRVNFTFDSHMKITGYKVYDDAMGMRIFQFCKDDDKIDFWASSALYTLFFYAESIHATIHVFHYLMTSAFQYVSEDFEPMHQWATYYANNIHTKYNQVASLLIREQPLPDPTGANQLNLDRANAVITGSNGFGSTEEVRPILADLLNMWGQSSSASGWLDVMMNISRKDMEKAGILTEFNKQTDLIKPFAKEAADAFRDIDADKSTIAELRLKDYLKRCGSFTSNIDSLESWIELMSVTGDVHGSTIGFTRLIAMPEVMRWRKIKDSKWAAADINMIFKVSATAVGMEDGRHVMGSKIEGPYDPKLQAVLDEFDEKTTRMKQEYETEIQKDPDFNDYGWILSAFCTDGFDGKQMTTASYI